MKYFKFLTMLLIAATLNFTACGNDVGGGGGEGGLINDYNVNLESLELSDGTLSPSFSQSTIAYNAELDYSVTSITVTPTSADAAVTITVNGVSVTSGTASGSISLDVGENTITTVVTAEDGTTTKTYTVVVTRLTFAESSNNADLSGLSLSAGTLSPTFSVNTASYNAEVNNDITSISVTPTVAGSGASVTVDGVSVTSGTASGSISIDVGENTITTVVTAEDGTTTKTYTVVVTRLEMLTVTYNVGTGNTFGTVPVDGTNYSSGDTVTVLENTGDLRGALIRDNIKQRFIGWNTDSVATTAEYEAGDTFTITEDTTLYAIYTTGTDVLRKVGPAGGWVFYDHGSYESWGRYLEAWNENEDGTSNCFQWKNNQTATTGTSTDIGTGYANTYTYMTGSEHPAAEVVRTVTHGGKNDWFLPSKDELWQMCWNLRGLKYESSGPVQNPDVPVGGVGGFEDYYYWSSSEYSVDLAWSQFFAYGTLYHEEKFLLYMVRAVRAF